MKSRSVALQMQLFNVQESYRNKVIDWANEVVFTLSECTTICELDPKKATDYFRERNRMRTKLSELIDRGRWFFENDKSSGYGQWKRGANQGIAPITIDIIKNVLIHDEKLNYMEASDNASHREPIVQLKKDFVDEIQQFVEPNQVYKEPEAIKNSIA